MLTCRSRFACRHAAETFQQSWPSASATFALSTVSSVPTFFLILPCKSQSECKACKTGGCRTAGMAHLFQVLVLTYLCTVDLHESCSKACKIGGCRTAGMAHLFRFLVLTYLCRVDLHEPCSKACRRAARRLQTCGTERKGIVYAVRGLQPCLTGDGAAWVDQRRPTAELLAWCTPSLLLVS